MQYKFLKVLGEGLFWVLKQEKSLGEWIKTYEESMDIEVFVYIETDRNICNAHN